MTQVPGWMQDLTESVIGGIPFKVGDTVKHRDGRTVKIVSGQYWGTYGLSNFWRWCEVLEDGALGPEEHGYGFEVSG